MENVDPLSLIPDQAPTEDRRRDRDNERRIEEFVRKLLVSMDRGSSDFSRRFLVMD